MLQSSWAIVEPFEGLMGVELFLGGILESNADICSTICPWNKFKLILQTRLMQFEKKMHTFFLLLRSSILKINYIFDFGYSISEIWSYRIPLKLLSNVIGLTWFGFFKTKLCPISHNDLIMEYFSRLNLYGVPRVTISSFGSQTDKQETKFHLLVSTFYRIQIQCPWRELWRFSHGHLF